MAELIDLNSTIPASRIDPAIATDAEYLAGDKAHTDAIDPHLQYPTQARADARYLRIDTLPPTYGGVTLPGSKGSYAGAAFPAGFGAPVFMTNTGDWQNGFWSAAASLNWMWQYNRGRFSIFNSVTPTTQRGLFVGFDKSTGSLPGYPTEDYPVVCTDHTHLYLRINNIYSAYFTANGTYVASSDKTKKENATEVDYPNILKKLLTIPIYEYSFKGESSKVRRCGPYAQDIYSAFKLGGDIVADESDPTASPDRVLAPMDMTGLLCAAVRALAAEVADLRSQLAALSKK